MLKIGDTVYWLSGDQKEIIVEPLKEIGMNEDGSVFVSDDSTYTLGAESWCFLSREDAERYRADPEAFPKDYAYIEAELPKLPFEFGADIYSCEDDCFRGRCDICIERYSSVWTNGERVCIGAGDSEYIVGSDPFFLTLGEARKYIKSKNDRIGDIIDMRE